MTSTVYAGTRLTKEMKQRIKSLINLKKVHNQSVFIRHAIENYLILLENQDSKIHNLNSEDKNKFDKIANFLNSRDFDTILKFALARTEKCVEDFLKIDSTQ